MIELSDADRAAIAHAWRDNSDSGGTERCEEAYRAGMRAMAERCANVCSEMVSLGSEDGPAECAAAIRALIK